MALKNLPMSSEPQNGLVGRLPTADLTANLVPIASEQTVTTVPDGGQKFPVGNRQENRQRSNISRELSKLGF